jgi:hypothetical protein
MNAIQVFEGDGVDREGKEVENYRFGARVAGHNLRVDLLHHALREPIKDLYYYQMHALLLRCGVEEGAATRALDNAIEECARKIFYAPWSPALVKQCIKGDHGDSDIQVIGRRIS